MDWGDEGVVLGGCVDEDGMGTVEMSSIALGRIRWVESGTMVDSEGTVMGVLDGVRAVGLRKVPGVRDVPVEMMVRRFQAESALTTSSLIGWSWSLTEGCWVLVSERIDGGSLRETMAQVKAEGKRWESASRLQVAHLVAEALAEYHGAGIAHGGLTTSNIFLTEHIRAEEDGPELFVPSRCRVRFSLSRRFYCGRPNSILGLDAIAPESLGNLDWADTAACMRADIFSLGTVLWELVHLQVPWGRVPYENVVERLLLDHARPSWTSEDPVALALKDIVLSCWESDPFRRPVAREALILLSEARMGSCPRGMLSRPSSSDSEAFLAPCPLAPLERPDSSGFDQPSSVFQENADSNVLLTASKAMRAYSDPTDIRHEESLGGGIWGGVGMPAPSAPLEIFAPGSGVAHSNSEVRPSEYIPSTHERPATNPVAHGVRDPSPDDLEDWQAILVSMTSCPDREKSLRDSCALAIIAVEASSDIRSSIVANGGLTSIERLLSRSRDHLLITECCIRTLKALSTSCAREMATKSTVQAVVGAMDVSQPIDGELRKSICQEGCVILANICSTGIGACELVANLGGIEALFVVFIQANGNQRSLVVSGQTLRRMCGMRPIVGGRLISLGIGPAIVETMKQYGAECGGLDETLASLLGTLAASSAASSALGTRTAFEELLRAMRRSRDATGEHATFLWTLLRLCQSNLNGVRYAHQTGIRKFLQTAGYRHGTTTYRIAKELERLLVRGKPDPRSTTTSLSWNQVSSQSRGDLASHQAHRGRSRPVGPV